MWQSVWNTTITRVEAHIRRGRSHLVIRVIVWAVLLFAVFNVVTGRHFVVIRVVLFLFPAMTIYTAVLQVAAITVVFCLLLSAPKAALLLWQILVLVRLAPIVLPIVRVFALVTHMTSDFVIEWAPDSLEVEHVEVRVLLHAMQQVNWEFILTVREGAQITEVTAFLRTFCAKLRLVLLWVIERFDSVVSLRTEWPFRALAGLCKAAHLWSVGPKRAPLVLLVVVEALLLIVTSFASARLSFEKSEVEQDHTILALTLALFLASRTRGCSSARSGCGRNYRFITWRHDRWLLRAKSSRIVIVAGIISFWCVLMFHGCKILFFGVIVLLVANLVIRRGAWWRHAIWILFAFMLGLHLWCNCRLNRFSWSWYSLHVLRRLDSSGIVLRVILVIWVKGVVAIAVSGIAKAAALLIAKFGLVARWPGHLSAIWWASLVAFWCISSWRVAFLTSIHEAWLMRIYSLHLISLHDFSSSLIQ